VKWFCSRGRIACWAPSKSLSQLSARKKVADKKPTSASLSRPLSFPAKTFPSSRTIKLKHQSAFSVPHTTTPPKTSPCHEHPSDSTSPTTHLPPTKNPPTMASPPPPPPAASAAPDTLLTALCTICHAAPPKYKCPRCFTRTCSLPCIQRHKARASCDGVRNARAFVPLAQLTTPAGWDHDYNFLTSIERACERRERELAAEGTVASAREEMRGSSSSKRGGAFRKVWFGDDLHHVPAGAAIPGVEEETVGRREEYQFDKAARRRLRQEGVEVVAMPRGMVRQRENATKWDRKTLSLNWQVEWLVYGVVEGGKPMRILRRMLEGKRVEDGLVHAMEWHASEVVRQAKEQAREQDEDDAPAKKKRTHRAQKKKPSTEGTIQDAASTAWLPSKLLLQDSETSAWRATGEEDDKTSARQFFLLQARTPPGQKALIPISPSDTLANALSGRTVIEFPTIYVFPSGDPLPEGFSLGPTERRKRKAEESGDEEEAEEVSRHPRKKVSFEGDENRTRRKWEPQGSRGRGRGGREGRGDHRGRGGRGGRGRGGRGGGNDRFERSARTVPEDVEEGEVASDGGEMEVDVRDKITSYDARPSDEKRSGGLVDYDSSGGSE